MGGARWFVLELISDLPEELQDSVSLMVSELATNALVHTSGSFDVDADRSDTAITVSITDRGNGMPVVQSPASSDPHGRGLRIVEILSDDWGITPGAGAGKTVWFRVALDDAPADRLLDGTPTTIEDEEANPAGEWASHQSTSLVLPEIGSYGQPTACSRITSRRNRRRLKRCCMSMPSAI